MDKEEEARNAYERWLAAAEYEEFVKTTYETLVDRKIGVVQKTQTFVGKKSRHAHQIDVSIELSIAELRLLILVECKHYKNRVAIGDVLEFAQRLDDIGAHKGVLVSTVGFQEGAVKVADGYGIALVKTAPVWQTIHHRVNEKGKSVGVSFGRVHVGFVGDRFVGVTVSLVNADLRNEPDFGDAWKTILEFLRCDITCSGCGRIIKVVHNGRFIGLPRGLCSACFISKHGLECPTCGARVTTATNGACPHCGERIVPDRFGDSRWYQCSCGKMIHVSDIHRPSARCNCGFAWSDKALRNLYWGNEDISLSLTSE